MRKLIVVALAAAAVAVPSAVAAQGGIPGRPADPAPAASAKKPVKPVAFVIRGVVKATDANAGTFDITVTGFNAHPKKILTKGADFTVRTDNTTKFSKAGKGKATFAELAVNDRVVVRYSAPRAPKGSTADYLSTYVAKRVVDQGPKPAS
jgi:hypothetical protein